MASHILTFETNCRRQYQSCVSRDLLLFQVCYRRDCLNSVRVLVQQRPSLFNPRVFCTNSESQGRTKKHRSTRAPKSDAGFRRELQLFLSSAGFPLDQVPSTKELSNRGREDLANIVRRRGYKAVARLLANRELGTIVQGNGNAVSSVEGAAATKDLNLASHPFSLYAMKLANGSARSERLSSSEGSDGMESRSLLKQPEKVDILFRENEDLNTLAGNRKPDTCSLDGSHTDGGSSNANQTEEALLQTRDAKFVKTGQLDYLQGSDEEEAEEDDENELDDYYEDSSEEEDDEQIRDGKKSAEDVAVEKATKLRAKLLPFIKVNAKDLRKLDNEHDDILASISRKQKDERFQGNAHMYLARETELELDQIKSALHSREVESVEISRELDETKAQLALVQAKMTAELAQLKQMALEKDIRLKSADKALANLKQVQIEYWGEGGRVELAGSFNGWQYFVCMEPDPTSEIPKSGGSRGAMMWEAELWLYPGVYEIKFVVDGNWQIDQRREVIMRNAHQNNLLRVEP